MKQAYLLSFFSLLLCCTSCRFVGGKRVEGDGNRVTVNRSVGEFKGVEVRGGIDVVLVSGNGHSIRIEADQNLIDFIEVNNDGGTVEVSSRDGYNLRSSKGIKVYATAPAFENVSVAGSGDIRSEGKVTSNGALQLAIKGSGDIQLAVDAPRVATEISGSGSAKLEGQTREFEAEINGNGDVHAFNLLSESAKVDIAGSGNAEVFASKQLNVEIKGAGDVAYKGSGTVSQKIMGSGSVRQVQ
ncbi:Putative auto-transporter adhesin, head GIN domain [Cnuella takakiae]|uniref:Putative auto-transporter adhesin, head GIN domain n=1 Tax=Cnuella takakiae TaxID=1302690 RepID=A0A1M5C558_9BACT|nr:head GIN domain-containing protein [Cnuella takakiae]OLY93637.1 hypothetical protein BUE76_18455 [Cnuella takakiae]SHF49904.1 Putative auto-transporter adhesin, head GIN domain [Cnuella takakiae]